MVDDELIAIQRQRQFTFGGVLDRPVVNERIDVQQSEFQGGFDGPVLARNNFTITGNFQVRAIEIETPLNRRCQRAGAASAQFVYG